MEGNIHLWGNRKCFPMSLPHLMRLLIQTDYWQKSLFFLRLARGVSTILSSTILSTNSISFVVEDTSAHIRSF